MGWEQIIGMILKFLPTLVSWIVELIKTIKGGKGKTFFEAASTDHGVKVIDGLIAALQYERAKLAPALASEPEPDAA